MQFHKGYLYHIFNQGNNRQKIFFNRDNYFFFLKKISEFICPYADIAAYCLMPNHFHLMVLVKEVELFTDPMTTSHRISKRTLNYSIAIMLRSYTRAINKQQNSSGSLFRPKTKAECINCPDGITPSFISGKSRVTKTYIRPTEMQYPRVCFEYIHNNPVKAGLVQSQTEWEFSSAMDYSGQRQGKLVKKEIAEEYGLANSSDSVKV